MENKKFLVIDGNSIMNRAFYGLMNSRMISSVLNIHTNALYAFLNTYWMINDKINPDYVAVSFDLRAPTFRHEMFKEYKGTRHAMPEELVEQMPVIKEILTAMNIPIFELEGYEADDILGTVANENTKNNIFTYILTGDRDSYQLISQLTSVVIPSTKNGKTEYTIYDTSLLKENLNIDPYQVIEVKSLMGDSSDNIPGVKGIGEKTAYSLIEKYSTLDNIYSNIDNLDVSAKIKEKLLADKEMAYMSHKLATIDINVPIQIDYDKCIVSDVNKEDLYKLFKDLEFNKFMSKFDFKEVEENLSNDNSNIKNNELEVKSTIIIDNNNINEYVMTLKKLFSEEKISYILNGTNTNNYTPTIGLDNKFLIGFYSDVNDNVYIINLGDIENNNNKLVKDLLLEFSISSCNKLGYNIKQDLLYLFNKITNNISGFSYDIMIASYLLDSNKSNYQIEDILDELFNTTISISNTSKNNEQISLFDDTKEEFLNKNDILNITTYLKGIYLSYDIINDNLSKLEMLELFNNIEMPLTETLAYMEHTGMYIDIEKLNEFDMEISTSLANLENDIYIIADEKFNINSTQQLGNILFNKLKLPTIKKNKTGFSTDKVVLEELEDKHEIISKLLDYRQLIKLKTTYVDGLRNKILNDGRIHTTFMQTVAATGRLSSVEPNLQNIPIRLELGRKIRNFFVGENDNLIMDADYSQIELRVLADISNDAVMINSFKEGIDIHRTTASQVFGVTLDEVTNEMRSHAKAVNFGIVYGISGFGLAKNIGTTKQQATEYINTYLEKYEGIHTFMTDIVKLASENGYVTTMFGRRRYIPELKQKNKNTIQFGERIAMNTPIQGTAADIIKIAMNKIYNELKKRKLKSKLIMQVHDELIIETTPDEIDIVKDIMRSCMENVVELKVPLDVDLHTAKTWYDAH